MKSSITSITPDKKFFTNKGKAIKQNVEVESKAKTNSTFEIYKNYSANFFKKDDRITSLFETEQIETEELSSLAGIIPSKRQQVWNNMVGTVASHKKIASTMMLSLIPLLGIVFFTNPVFSLSRPHAKYAIFSSKPLTVGGVTEEVTSGDPRAAKLDNVFAEYGCPNFVGKGSVFVAEADKNNIPYWLIPAISFQESDCGNITPQKDGQESFNAYGWGIWGKNVKDFANWETGIATVSKYMSDKFYSKGVTDLCTIMKTYTPPSKGSWCAGVEHFHGVIENYQTP